MKKHSVNTVTFRQTFETPEHLEYIVHKLPSDNEYCLISKQDNNYLTLSRIIYYIVSIDKEENKKVELGVYIQKNYNLKTIDDEIVLIFETEEKAQDFFDWASSVRTMTEMTGKIIWDK